MSEPLRVAVLQGGRSLERAVSLRSGARVRDGLGRLGHTAIAIDTDGGLIEQLIAARADVAFIALHGRDGEDGTIQEVLEALAIPYTGSAPAACVRATDKVLAKHLMRAAGIPTPPFFALHETVVKELGGAGALPSIEADLGFPLVVKPARGGSALGVKFARQGSELPGAMVGAFSYDFRILLERHIRGRDLAVSVIEDEAPEALPVLEAVPREEDFYDYESRYGIGMTTFLCPAELEPGTTARAQELALEVYGLLGCHGFARVDLMLEQDSGELYVLETNVVPGLTETSLLPQAADAAGIGFDELLARILASALKRR
jgi:D-alanine-D-alanine ligase